MYEKEEKHYWVDQERRENLEIAERILGCSSSDFSVRIAPVEGIVWNGSNYREIMVPPVIVKYDKLNAIRNKEYKRMMD